MALSPTARGVFDAYKNLIKAARTGTIPLVSLEGRQFEKDLALEIDGARLVVSVALTVEVREPDELHLMAQAAWNHGGEAYDAMRDYTLTPSRAKQLARMADQGLPSILQKLFQSVSADEAAMMTTRINDQFGITSWHNPQTPTQHGERVIRAIKHQEPLMLGVLEAPTEKRRRPVRRRWHMAMGPNAIVAYGRGFAASPTYNLSNVVRDINLSSCTLHGRCPEIRVDNYLTL